MRTATRLGVALAAASLIPLLGTSSAFAEPTTTTSLPPPKPPALNITVSPNNPLILTGQSEVHAVVQVEAAPRLSSSGPIDISSTQLAADCATVVWHTLASGIGSSLANPGVSGPGIGFDYSSPIYLDNDGNATVKVDATNCQAGSDLFAVSLTGPPYTTATTTLHVKAPMDTPVGVTGYPKTTRLPNGNFVKGEVETGDTTSGPNISGDSDVYAMFMVEVPSYYAGKTVQIQSNELISRCLTGSFWESNQGVGTSSTVWTAKVDNNGNATIDFFGTACAAGTSKVIAHVLAGTHPTYTTTFRILSPQQTW